MTQRYSSWRSACLSAMCRFRDAFEHSTLPHSWHVNTFLGDAPATAKPSSLWSGPRVLPPADTRLLFTYFFLSLSPFLQLNLTISRVTYAICPRELSITANHKIRACPCQKKFSPAPPPFLVRIVFTRGGCFCQVSYRLFCWLVTYNAVLTLKTFWYNNLWNMNQNKYEFSIVCVHV